MYTVKEKCESYLLSCLQDKKMSPFPAMKKCQLACDIISSVIIEICPICLLPNGRNIMVFCENYKKWYHKDCMPKFDKNDTRNNWNYERCTLTFGNE